MRCFILLCCFLLIHTSIVEAKSPQHMSEEEQLGTMAGLAFACGSKQKLEDFELIASRLLANKSSSDAEEKQKIRIYMQAKWQALQQQKSGSDVSCTEILEHFDKLPLFNSIVYRDGSVKLPDGKWSRPIRTTKRR